jgi:threonine/homoserine/homoserine lactone efflux protein
MASAIWLGLPVGFLIAASPGPIFFLVLRRTLARGWRSGLASGLGVASGDAMYAGIAAFGVAVITNALLAQRRWIALVGGLAIALIGLRAIFRPNGDAASRPACAKRDGGGMSLSGAYISILALTLSNPPTILSFTAVFAGLGLRVGTGWQSALGLVIGVMVGSAVWWIVVTVLASLLRERLRPQVTRAIAVVSGVILVALGIVISVQSLKT